MKHFLPFFLLLALSCNVIAQRALPQQVAPTGERSAANNQQFVLPASSFALPDEFNKQLIADTLLPTIFNSPCAVIDSLQLFGINQITGFVMGSNGYFDFEKIQRITLPEPTSLSISSVFFFVGAVDSTILNQKIVANIYTDLNTDGSFGDFLGASDTLLIGDFSGNLSPGSIGFSQLNFSTPVALESATSFMVGIDVSDVYNSPSAGDIGFAHTDEGCGDGNNVIEIFPTDNGLAFNTIFANWQGLNIELLVGVIVDRDPFTSVRTPNVDFSANAFPNPADDQLTIQFQAPAAGKYTTKLVAPNGQVVRTQTIDANRGSTNTSLLVADLPAGIYLFQVQGASGVQTGRVVIR